MGSKRRQQRHPAAATFMVGDPVAIYNANPDLARRMGFVYQSLAQIRRSISAFKEEGGRDPAVLVCDLRDKEGRKLVEQIHGPELARTTLEESARLGTVPATVIIGNRGSIAQRIGHFSLTIGPKIAATEAPDGEIWAVVVADGRTAMVTLPLEMIEGAEGTGSPPISTGF